MSKVNATERILNLIIALVNTKRGLTRDEIQAGIHGYKVDATKVAFERMFERDKMELRNLGIPLETLGTDGAADDIRYRIDPDNYALAEIEFNRAELTTIALTNRIIQDAGLQSELGSAVTKLLPVTDDILEISDDVALTAHMRPLGENFVLLAEAVQHRQEVTFTYQAANTGEATSRHLQPYRLRIDEGARYVHGFDTDRGETRTFRLSRIVGDVKVSAASGAYEIPEHAEAQTQIDTTPVVLAIRADQAHHIRRLGCAPSRAVDTAALSLPAGSDLVQIDTDNPARLAETLASCGPDVLVLEPESVRNRVIEILRAAAGLGGHNGE